MKASIALPSVPVREPPEVRVQLSDTPGSLPEPGDLAEALRNAADRLGHRPALTVVRPDRRDEQGFASLARWASKGAHLLQLEALLDPGDRVRLHSPADWPAVAVCLAAWWIGVEVSMDADARVAVVHHSLHAPDDADEVYALGDGVDGSPDGPTDHEPWSVAVQTFPDQPPEPRAAPDRPAASAGNGSWTQAELLRAAAGWETDGPLGVQRDEPAAGWLPAVVRPFVTGHPTVILAGAEHTAADAEGVAVWV